jgi:predicted PurR-regulated permease PerM
MPLAPEHEIHRRRLGRNLGLGLVLVAFVGLIFALTVVKVSVWDQSGHVTGDSH